MKDEKKIKGEGGMVFIHPSSLLFHPWFSAASIALSIALALFTVS